MTTQGIIGGVFLGLGLVTLIGRFMAPDSHMMFSKLQPMKDYWGEGRGTALHVVAYTVLPIVVGAVLVLG